MGAGCVSNEIRRRIRRSLIGLEEEPPYRTKGHETRAQLQQLEVFPRETVMRRAATQQLLVSALSSSGPTRDITAQVRYESQNPSVVDVDNSGRVTAVEIGETNVLVRAAGRTLNIRIGVIGDRVVEFPPISTHNFIDEHVFSKLEKFRIVPSDLSDDAEFLRRACLDIIGTLPPPHRVRAFLDDADPGKRDKLIDVLLDSPEYVDFWTFRFSDLFRVSQTPDYSQLYWEWIRSSIASNKPYDQMARERLAAQGRDRPSRHYSEDNSQPERILAEELRIFAGRRFDCAQCHDHPFEPWSQDQFWGLAAFFGNLDFVGYYDLVFDNPAGGYGDKGKIGPLLHPRKQTVVKATFLDGTPLSEHQQRDPRLEFAHWLTAHPFFAEAIVNRIWGYFFGRGIVDPVDDFKASNPPTHPSLLVALASDFREKRPRFETADSADRRVASLSAHQQTKRIQSDGSTQLLPFHSQATGSRSAPGRYFSSDGCTRGLQRGARRGGGTAPTGDASHSTEIASTIFVSVSRPVRSTDADRRA